MNAPIHKHVTTTACSLSSVHVFQMIHIFFPIDTRQGIQAAPRKTYKPYEHKCSFVGYLGQYTNRSMFSIDGIVVVRTGFHGE